MDYSNYHFSIIFEYFISFLGVLLSIIFLICGIVYLLKQYLQSKNVVEFIGIIACAVVIIVIAYFSRNYFKDIPNIVIKNYTITYGVVVEGDNGGRNFNTRGIVFKKEDGEIVKLVVNYYPIVSGEKFEVIYLPNTGFGAIIQKIE